MCFLIDSEQKQNLNTYFPQIAKQICVREWVMVNLWYVICWQLGNLLNSYLAQEDCLAGPTRPLIRSTFQFPRLTHYTNFLGLWVATNLARIRSLSHIPLSQIQWESHCQHICPSTKKQGRGGGLCNPVKTLVLESIVDCIGGGLELESITPDIGESSSGFDRVLALHCCKENLCWIGGIKYPGGIVSPKGEFGIYPTVPL